MTLRGLILCLVGLAVASGGCRPQPRFTRPVRLADDKVIPVETLEDGYEGYMLYCYACHGEKGDGRGPAAATMRPPPRDFTRGMFKFGGVAPGSLPVDEDLVAVVAHGLDGTPMLAWDIPDRERLAIVQYLKTLSPRWKEETPGPRILPDQPDPWVGKEAESIALGKRLYHLQGMSPVKDARGMPSHVYAGCNGCHPSYIPKSEIAELAREALGKEIELRADPYHPAADKKSDYVVDGHPVLVLPTDFLFQKIKNGTDPLSLYRTTAGGIDGTAMPQWKGVIKDADLWALAHYVASLAAIRGTPTALAFQAHLLTPFRARPKDEEAHPTH